MMLALISTFLMGGFMKEDKSDKAQKAEAERLCKIYTEKIKEYRASMRDDELAQATLDNYIRIRDKNCAEAKSQSK